MLQSGVTQLNSIPTYAFRVTKVHSKQSCHASSGNRPNQPYTCFASLVSTSFGEGLRVVVLWGGGSAAAEDFPTEDLELVVLSFISDPSPSQVQELTAAATNHDLLSASVVFVKLLREATPESVEPSGVAQVSNSS